MCRICGMNTCVYVYTRTVYRCIIYNIISNTQISSFFYHEIKIVIDCYMYYLLLLLLYLLLYIHSVVYSRQQIDAQFECIFFERKITHRKKTIKPIKLRRPLQLFSAYALFPRTNCVALHSLFIWCDPLEWVYDYYNYYFFPNKNTSLNYAYLRHTNFRVSVTYNRSFVRLRARSPLLVRFLFFKFFIFNPICFFPFLLLFRFA